MQFSFPDIHSSKSYPYRPTRLSVHARVRYCTKLFSLLPPSPSALVRFLRASIFGAKTEKWDVALRLSGNRSEGEREGGRSAAQCNGGGTDMDMSAKGKGM